MNTDFEKSEKKFLQTMRMQKKEEITPPKMLKIELDKALAAKRRKSSVFALRMPVYQVAAAAAIFFILGFAANFLRPTPLPEILHSTTEVIKYVDRPVTEIRYVKVPVVQKNEQVAVENKNYSVSVSLQEDTILQKMLVNIY